MNSTAMNLPPPLPMHKEPINQRISFESDSTLSDDSELNEHDFWQAHSTTMIISPTQHRPMVSLATQVKQILGSTMEETDQAIEQEWTQSRQRLDHTLSHLPSISF
ncbi:hypothetical protein BD560DRAFT_416399 [Blakeslea trispora]|nr:hypothetical protein BD560DRAFT_416399 [Blakeslea trispora]